MNEHLMYKSTRGNGGVVTASQAILKGLAEDGGLYVPEFIPKLEVSLQTLAAMTYQETAYEVMRLFFTDYDERELRACIQNAYDEKFDTDEITPLVEVGGAFHLELFHGETLAFKDMALSILPHLMKAAARMNEFQDEIVILTATSGDTGKAALAGFADVEGTRILVFYPKDGVSPIQEKQMVTQKGSNTHVIGVEGNFDDCQSGVKAIFHDEALRKRLKENGIRFSSANSINIGRLIPQVVYYVHAYAKLLKQGSVKDGETINVVVPTGNFGNILAAYYAKQMGLPIDMLICASNTNKVLFDFLKTGTYDRNRDLVITSSPSMDILISSNLERLIYKIAGEDAKTNAGMMEDLIRKGRYEVTEEMKKNLNDFYGGFATESEVVDTIHQTFTENQYVLDPHTAVAAKVHRQYVKETDDRKVTVIVSTASPYKFAGNVMGAIDASHGGASDFESVDELNRVSGVPIPKAIEELRSASNRHHTVCPKDRMGEMVKRLLDGGVV